jgi:YesN/AraC family two-component response regulator
MKRVLVVEDNSLERKLIVRLLNSLLKYIAIVDDVPEGALALEYMSSSNYNLVITDLIMPNIEGLELISKMKRDHNKCKIIAISGSKPFYLHMAKKLGVDYIFTKPLDKERFSESVTSLLNGS